MTEHPNYGYWVKHPAHNPKGTHNTIPLTEADKRDGWTEVVLVAQQPAAHVQNPAGIEHVAGDVSKNGPESNMAQQPAPSAAAASKAVLAAIRAANMQLVRTGDDEFMLVTFKQATPQADSQPAPVNTRQIAECYRVALIHGADHSDFENKPGAYWSSPTQPAQADSPPLPALEIRAPNKQGEASCIVRWEVETPAGWVGAWSKEALEFLLDRPQAADSVLEDAARLEQIAEAIRDYHHALDLRKHGGLAESAAFNSICQTMDMPWNQGEEAARRAARKQGGAT